MCIRDRYRPLPSANNLFGEDASSSFVMFSFLIFSVIKYPLVKVLAVFKQCDFQRAKIQVFFQKKHFFLDVFRIK